MANVFQYSKSELAEFVKSVSAELLAAKNAEALRVMNEKIRENKINKYYLCLVHGVPPKKNDILRGYLRKDSKSNTVEVRDKYFNGAKEIVTGYTVLEITREPYEKKGLFGLKK